MVTLRDLAQACGCSVTSASRALKDHPSISKRLREKVHQVALDMDYIPNSIAGSMRTGITNTIAVIIQDTMNPYYSIVTNTIEKHAAARGFNTIIITTRYEPERELEAVNVALRKKVDGVLLFPIQQDANALDLLERSGTPFVLVGRTFDNRVHDCVLPDDRQGVYLTTKHLLEQGRRRLMMINSFRFISSSRMREDGFRAALAEHGLKAAEGDVHYIGTDKGMCAEVIRSVFTGTCPYDAVCCYNDVLAYEAYYELKLLGWQVPEDVALTGVDDLHAYLTFPVRATSAGYDIRGLGTRAVELLLSRLDAAQQGAGPGQRQLVVMNQYLVVGETT